MRYHGMYKDLNINVIWPGKDPTLGPSLKPTLNFVNKNSYCGSLFFKIVPTLCVTVLILVVLQLAILNYLIGERIRVEHLIS